MIDITEIVKECLSNKIRANLEKVSVYKGKWKKLSDLRVLLKKEFPVETFGSDESTLKFLKVILDNDEVEYKTDFKDPNDNGKIITVFESRKAGKVKDEKKPVVQPPVSGAEVKTSGGKKTDGNTDCRKPESVKDGKQYGGEDTDGKKADDKYIDVNKTGAQPPEGRHERRSSDGRTDTRPYINQFAYFGDRSGEDVRLNEALAAIADAAVEETWKFKDDRDEYSILKKYLGFVIKRLEFEGKILTAEWKEQRDGQNVTCKRCAVNTGLLSRRNYQDIYLIFNANIRDGEQPWYFQLRDRLGRLVGIIENNQDPALLPFGSNRPKRAEFGKDVPVSCLIYRHEYSYLNTRHILEDNLRRLPMTFLMRSFLNFFMKNTNWLGNEDDWKRLKEYFRAPEHAHEYGIAVALLERAINAAQAKARDNSYYRVNMYYPEKKTVEFFLPLYFDDEEFPEVGVVVDNSEGIYTVRTIFTLSMAYPKIRLMGERRDWLKPTQIKEWKDPNPDNSKE